MVAFHQGEQGGARHLQPDDQWGSWNVSLQQVDEAKWFDLGACRGLEAAIFYPDDEESAVSAKAVCESCHVKVSCLEHALANREKAGVWGGATERDRRRIVRQRRKSA
jgi:WhiB family transcriptional regulator, redox-sensing transcriptional regulator